MLRLEGGNARVAELLPRHGDGVADGENAGVEHADDVPGVGLVHNLPLRRHHLLGLGEAHFLAGLDVEVLRVPLEAAGADAHKGQTVPVGLVHVGLNFEDEGGEVRGKRVDLLLSRHAA